MFNVERFYNEQDVCYLFLILFMHFTYDKLKKKYYSTLSYFDLLMEYIHNPNASNAELPGF